MPRKISLKQFRFLDTELTRLKEEGLDQETADRIRKMYEVTQSDPHRRTRWVFLALTALAVLMFGMAILLLICHNWQYFAPAAKIAVIFVPWLTSFLAGALTRRRVVLSELLLFGAAILYGIGIWQIVQIFHYPADFSEGAWYWGIGAWLTAFAARTPVLPISAVSILFCWSFHTQLNMDAGAFTLPFTALIGWIFFQKRSMPSAALAFKYLLFSWGVFLPNTFADKDFFWLFWAFWGSLFFFPRVFLFRKNPISFELVLLGIALLGLSVYECNTRLISNCRAITLPLTIFGNIAALALFFFLLRRRGKGSDGSFLLAILYFLIWSVVQYNDLFGSFGGYIGAALIFCVMALLLAVTAAVWYRSTKPSSPEPADSDPGTAEKQTFIPLTGTCAAAVLAAAFLIQFTVPLSMAVSRTIAFRGAVHITVETVPVDPRSLFCGDYVRLNYNFTDPNLHMIDEHGNWVEADLFDNSEIKNKKLHRNETIYTIMNTDPDGISRPVKMTITRPTDEIFIKGKYRRFNIQYGIDTWYVEEGKGKEIEDALRRPNGSSEPDAKEKRVLVDLAVSKHGTAKIENVRIVDTEPVKEESKSE